MAVKKAPPTPTKGKAFGGFGNYSKNSKKVTQGKGIK